MSAPVNQGLDATFHALAHPVRRAILAQLAEESATILEIAGHFELSLNGVSKHVKVLEQAGLIQRNVQGRTHHCSLDATRLSEAGAWMWVSNKGSGTRGDESTSACSTTTTMI